ncbi:MAG: hypothetical protein OEV49_17385 [candidate division Zixibacteria bacterium]|nr:hypothetical protein [candidate division Zixibacteria bacterium]MDH3938944.1 hypothetical protein [candidate division Zixibacteria bacterium]MDH4032604.1 hypothetical protein [candidate division Zixibacteria bacterium]
METENNKSKRALLLRTANETLNDVLKRGFFGMVCFSISIQDGDIQEVEAQVTKKKIC